MYKLNKTGITRLSDLAQIPYDKENSQYQHYLDWLSQGNTPLPMDPEPTPGPTPNEVALTRIIQLLEQLVAKQP